MNNKRNYFKIIRDFTLMGDYMNKFSRNQRVAAITKLLVENPNRIINLNNFTELFNAAKSTISEDLFIVRDTLSRLNLGRIETVSGAAGGVKYICGIPKDEAKEYAVSLCEALSDKSRMTPGDIIYMTDLICKPEIVNRAALILASAFSDFQVDYVVTVETKGIPLAYEVSKKLGVQLVIVRRENKITEGPSVSINYVSGSDRRIQNMSLSKKAMKKGSSCIFIDDFMKAGGTAFGIIDLLKEFESTVSGIGILVDNVKTQKKMVHDYVSIIDLIDIDEEGTAILKPSKLFR